MKTNGTGQLRPAIRLIQQFDPATWARMKAADWTVEAIGANDLFGIMVRNGVPFDEARGTSAHFAQFGMGLTLTGNPNNPGLISGELDGNTWLNLDRLNLASEQTGIALDNLTASVLVHEFNHHEGGDEPEAYNAGSNFARRLGDRKLLATSEQSRRDAWLMGLQAKLDNPTWSDV